MATTAEMIEALLGVNTFKRVNHITNQIGVAAEQIAIGSPQRASLLFVNLSANVMYVSPDQEAAATHGIRLAPNGGTVAMIWDRDLELVTEEWWGIAGGANSDIFVLESIIH